MKKEKIKELLEKISFDERNIYLEDVYFDGFGNTEEVGNNIKKTVIFSTLEENKRVLFIIHYLKDKNLFVLDLSGQRDSSYGWESNVTITKSLYEKYKTDLEKAKKQILGNIENILNKDKSFRIIKVIQEIKIKDLTDFYVK